MQATSIFGWPISPGTSYAAGILWTVWFGNNNDGWRIWNQYFESYQGQYSVEVGLFDVDAGVRALLDNPDCAAFVTSLLEAVETDSNHAQTTNGRALFGMIGSIVFEQQMVGGHKVSGTVGGSINQGNATINISPVSISSSAGPNSTLYQEVQFGYLMTALHEMIHHGGQNGGYDDIELSQAAYDLASPQGRQPLPQRDDYETFFKFNTDRSTYWNNALNDHCNPARRRR